MTNRPHLFEAFSAYTNLPIRIDDVVEQVKSYDTVDDVEIYSVDINPDILLGMHRMTIRGQRRVCQVFYANALEDDNALRRLVCTKEILHILDNDTYSAKSREAVSKLIEQIVVPPSSGIAPSNSTASDRSGVVFALLVLAPRDALDIIRPKVENGEMSVSEFATLAEIPERYARLVLSPVWRPIVEAV